MEVVLEMLFLTLNNTNFQFDAKKFIWRSYTAIETLSTISRIELIIKRKFAKVVLDKNLEIFVVHVLALEAMTIHLF